MKQEGDDMNTQTAAISTTTTDQVEDTEKVVSINQDKLKNVDDKTIIEACEQMEDIDNQRANLNDQAGEIRSRLKNLGIPTASFNAAYQRYKKTEKQRAEMDAGYQKCCKAMGVWYQDQLFNESGDS